MVHFGRKEAPIEVLPFPIYLWTVIGLVLFGLFDSVYLFISHYRVHTDIGYRSFCAITKAINCDTISQSPYSILWSIPVPLWGIFGYALLLILLTLAADKQADQNRVWSALFFSALLYSLISIVFAFISTYHIRSYCIMCIAIYGINLLILYYTWLIRRRFDTTPILSALIKDFSFFAKIKKKVVFLLTPFLAGWILTVIFLPPYWEINPPPLSGNISHGLTEQGYPWIGAQNPKLVISEFADYQCFQCKKMHFHLRALVAQHPNAIRLVHRHFPMDNKFNPLVKQPLYIGSGTMSLIAIYAISEGKFWQTNDLLFEIAAQKQPFNTTEIAKQIGMDVGKLTKGLRDSSITFKLLMDIKEGLRLGLTGTPGFVINGEVFHGNIPSGTIKRALIRE